MDALQKNIAVTRGEALAAHLLASAALQAVFAIVADKEQMLRAISAMIDDTLNNSGPGKRIGDDEFNTLMRETARNMVDQTLAAIARGPRSYPPASH
jgi:transcription termination factor NusB